MENNNNPQISQQPTLPYGNTNYYNATRKRKGVTLKRVFCIIVPIIIILILVVPFLVFVFTFVAPQEAVFLSLGEYEVVEYCEAGVFQDFTIYYEITYENPNIKNNKYLKQMTETDIEELNLYLDDFDGWVELHIDANTESQFIENYDFDRDIISTNDYCYIYDSANYDDFYEKFNSYDLYFYDTETEILYYFHNNI